MALSFLVQNLIQEHSRVQLSIHFTLLQEQSFPVHILSSCKEYRPYILQYDPHPESFQCFLVTKLTLYFPGRNSISNDVLFSCLGVRMPACPTTGEVNYNHLSVKFLHCKVTILLFIIQYLEERCSGNTSPPGSWQYVLQTSFIDCCCLKL